MRQAELIDCKSSPADLIVNSADVQARLPSGFTARFAGSETLAEVVLAVYTCDGIVLDNQTVLSPASFALTNALVDVNQTLAENSTYQWYTFEVFTDQPALLDFFTSAGFPVQEAAISLTYANPQVSLTVAVGGETWYQGSGSFSEAQTGTIEFVQRWFHDSGTLHGLDFQETRLHDGQAEAMLLEVKNGFLRNIKPGEAFAGGTSEMLVRGTLTPLGQPV